MTIIANHRLLDCLFDSNSPFLPQHDLIADSSANINLSHQEIWLRSIDHLEGLRSLEDDWDGQRSIAPAADLLESAIELACWLRDRQAPPPLFAIAGVNGTVQFEWISHRYEHYFAIEVVAPNEVEICSKLGADREIASGTFRW